MARILSQYSDKDWETLLRVLRDDGMRLRLIETAEIVSANHLAKKSEEGVKPPHGRVNPLTSDLERKDPNKFRVLSELRRKLLSKEILGQSKQLKEFAFACGLKGSEQARRDRVTNDLLRYLAAKPTEQIKELLATVPHERDRFGAEYENWVRIILGRDSANKHPADVEFVMSHGREDLFEMFLLRTLQNEIGRAIPMKELLFYLNKCWGINFLPQERLILRRIADRTLQKRLLPNRFVSQGGRGYQITSLGTDRMKQLISTCGRDVPYGEGPREADGSRPFQN